MRVVGICGSPKRESSSTASALHLCLDTIAQAGITTECIELSAYRFGGCEDCGGCYHALTCTLDDDFTNLLLPRLAASDIAAFVFASPVYFGGMSGAMKLFFDRSIVLRRNGMRWAERVAGAVSVGRARNGGQECANVDMLRAALIHGMIVVSDGPPTSHFGGTVWSGIPDGPAGDDYGRRTVQNLGKTIASVTKRLCNSAEK